MEGWKDGRVKEGKKDGRMEGWSSNFPIPGLKKFQNVAGISAGIGFVLGLLIPAVAIFSLHWQCPFGDGILQVGGFMAITGVGSAIVLGNLTALILIGVAKIKQGRKTQRDV